MKNIAIAVPVSGASIQLTLRGGASSGQAVIVASDEVEIHYTDPAPAAATNVKVAPIKDNGKAPSQKAPAHDLDAIFMRLAKLKPTKRAAAVNSIKSMFQFTAPISDDAADKILEGLRRRGNLTIDAEGKLQIRNA